MHANLKTLMLVAGLACCTIAMADSASDSLTRIEAETLVLKAREKQLDVQAKIMARQTEIAAKQAESSRSTQSASPGNPVITSIEGLGKTMFATLQMDNGNLIDVQSGDVLSNGYRVVSIRPNEVIVETSRKRRVRLAAASTSVPSFDPSFPSSGLRLPPLPPLAPPSAMPSASQAAPRGAAK